MGANPCTFQGLGIFGPLARPQPLARQLGYGGDGEHADVVAFGIKRFTGRSRKVQLTKSSKQRPEAVWSNEFDEGWTGY